MVVYADEIKRRIESKRGSGAYGEGYISEAVKAFNDLENMVRSGELSQKDYIAIGNELLPSVSEKINSIPYISQGAVQAAQGAGIDKFNREISRNFNIYKNAQEMLGRDLTQNEFAQIAPRFGTGNPQDLEVGRAFIAQLAEQEGKSPKGLQSKAGQYSGDVNTIFNDLLKRGASQEEVNHFGGLLASGDVDAYTLRQFVSQLPEYTEARSAEASTRQAEEDRLARESLGQELQGYDQSFFNKAKEDVISRYAKAGIQNSPSLDFALTNLMGDIQKERSAYLSDIARRDYESARGYKREDLLANRGMAREDYLTNLDRMFGASDYSRGRSDNFSDLLTNRSFGSIDYQRQQDDLMRLLANQPRQKSGGLAPLLGGLAGAGIGAFATRSPQGAQAGYSIGQGVGSGYDYLNY